MTERAPLQWKPTNCWTTELEGGGTAIAIIEDPTDVIGSYVTTEFKDGRKPRRWRDRGNFVTMWFDGGDGGSISDCQPTLQDAQRRLEEAFAESDLEDMEE